jgi:small subunit ribosomal protein S8
MMTDIIADSLTRIRNAALRKLETTTLIYSNSVVGILEVLKNDGYIDSYKVKDEKNNKKSITVVLKYDENEKSVINELKRESKPGRRVYVHANELKSFKNGYGTMIVSTNKGIIGNKEAFAHNVGGELLCSVW